MREHALEWLRRSERSFADETSAPVLHPGRGERKPDSYGPVLAMIADVYAADRKGE